MSRCVHYMYLIRIREFVRSQEPVYKAGKTRQEANNRLQGYPPGSEIVLVHKVHDCDAMEPIVLKMLRTEFKHRPEFGREYFEGEEDKMAQRIVETIHENQLKAQITITFQEFELNSPQKNQYLCCTLCHYRTTFETAYRRHMKEWHERPIA